MTKINFNLRNVIAAAICLVSLTASVSAWAQDVQWKKNFGGSDFDYYQSVTAVSDGVVAAGYSYPSSFGNGDWAGVEGKGGADAILVKYDNNGNVVWKKNFGGSDFDYYQSVTAISDGVVAAGSSSASSFGTGDWAGVAGKGNDDAILVKYDNNGNVVWKKNFGGSDIDYYTSVTAVSDGIVAAGISNSSSFGNGDWAGVTGKGHWDAILVKYDNNGNVVWKKNFGGSDIDYYTSVTAVSDGIVAAGISYPDSFVTGDWTGITGKGSIDAILVKYDNNGNVVWKKNFGGSGGDYYDSVTAVSDGFVAAGYSGSNSFGNGDWAGVEGKGYWDAILVKYSITTGIEQVNMDAGELKIYPNPVKDELTIENGELTIENVVITDLSGRIVMVVGAGSVGAGVKPAPTTGGAIINVSALPSGVYFIKVGNMAGKFVKE